MASLLALGALLGIAILALFPDPRLLPPTALLPEKTALLFLAALFVVALVPSLHRKLSENRDAATFAFLCAFSCCFTSPNALARAKAFRCGSRCCPKTNFRFPTRFDSRFWARFCRFRRGGKAAGQRRFIVAALGLIGALGVGSFWFLARFYAVGPTETLDPTPLATLFLQILGYGALAALCRAATNSPATTRVLLRLMPLLLALVWAKLHFFPAPLPAEEDE